MSIGFFTQGDRESFTFTVNLVSGNVVNVNCAPKGTNQSITVTWWDSTTSTGTGTLSKTASGTVTGGVITVAPTEHGWAAAWFGSIQWNISTNSLNTTAMDFSKVTNVNLINIPSSGTFSSLVCKNMRALNSLEVQGNSSLSSIDMTGSRCEGIGIDNTAMTSTAFMSAAVRAALLHWSSSPCLSMTGALDLSNCPNMTDASFGNSSHITSLDVTGDVKLQTLNGGNCTSLASVSGLSTCTALQTLSLFSNSLSGTLDITANTNLTYAQLDATNVTTFLVTNLPKITLLDVSYSPNQVSIDLNGCNKLQYFTVAHCPSFTTINNLPDTATNNWTNIILSSTAMTAFTPPTHGAYVLESRANSISSLAIPSACAELDIDGHALATLTYTSATGLHTLNMNNTFVATMDTSSCTGLYQITITNNTLLTGVDFSASASTLNNPGSFGGQTNVYIVGNALMTSISLAGFAGGGYINTSSATSSSGTTSCFNNALTATAINNLFTGLATAYVTGNIIDVSGNPGSALCNPAIATAKGYVVVQ